MLAFSLPLVRSGGRGERFNSTLPSDGGDVTVAFWAADFAFRFRVH